MMRYSVRALGGVVAWLTFGCSGTVDLHEESDATTTAAPTMKVELGQASYEFAGCPGIFYQASGDDGNGPIIQALSSNNDPQQPNCSRWAVANPDVLLDVYFRDVPASSGLPIGAFDVAESDAVLIQLSAGTRTNGQLTVGYRIYRSDVAGARGTVTSTRVDARLVRVHLADVTIAANREGNSNGSFPEQASVPEATLYFVED